MQTWIPITGTVLLFCEYALVLLKEISFVTGKLDTLKLEVKEDNERAIAFYKKSGFSEESRSGNMIFMKSVSDAGKTCV